MNTGYVEFKDFSALERKFSLVFGSQNVVVYVWRDVAGLKRNTIFEGDYLGAYAPFPERKSRGLFGEVHIIVSQLSPGYIAHEIQHLVFDWMQTQRQDDELNERLAMLAGEITDRFWNLIEQKESNAK